jgi:hypothetical protein
VKIELDASGTRIPSMRIDAGLDDFTCPAGPLQGVRLSGGGFSVTIEPGLEISGDAFDSDGFSGTFTSPTEVSGTYDLSRDYDCDHVVDWSATKE